MKSCLAFFDQYALWRKYETHISFLTSPPKGLEPGRLIRGDKGKEHCGTICSDARKQADVGLQSGHLFKTRHIDTRQPFADPDQDITRLKQD